MGSDSHALSFEGKKRDCHYKWRKNSLRQPARLKEGAGKPTTQLSILYLRIPAPPNSSTELLAKIPVNTGNLPERDDISDLLSEWFDLVGKRLKVITSRFFH